MNLKQFLWLACFVIVATFGVIFAQQQYRSAVGLAQEPTVVIVQPGQGLRSIAHHLTDAGVLSSVPMFVLGVMLSGKAGDLQAGEYEFLPDTPMSDVVEMLVRGETLIRRITVIEGETVARAMAKIAAAEGLTGTFARNPVEGSLLPETYFYRRGETREAMLRRMEEMMREILAQAWAGRAKNLPLQSPDEALVLASIVEKETALPEERPQIAAVFINRLRRKMRLQSDPTVIYGIALEDPKATERPLRSQDLGQKHPWNTYVIRGLPPTPISNPGRESILAVMHPAESDNFYFVADGAGGHAFATTLEEHNRNAARWRALRDAQDAQDAQDATKNENEKE